MKVLSIFVLIAFLTTTQSQTLTQSFNEPVVGDVDKKYRLDTSAYTSGLPLNLTGTNCVWNFSDLTGAFPMVIDSFISPSAAAGGSAYPLASFVQRRDNLNTFYRSLSSPQQTELLGGNSPSISLTFTNSAIIASYPISYGYNLSDPVSGTFTYNTTSGAGNGSITISVPGTGTLNMPNGFSIPNVLCLKSVEILTLSLNFFPFGTFNQTIYNYYMPGKKFPVLNINYTTYNLITGTPTITAFVYGSNDYYMPIGISQNENNTRHLKVFPNPFQNELFSASHHKSDNVLYRFFNLTGSLVLQSNDLSSQKLERLTPGIYFLETQHGQQKYRQKIIKE